MADVAGQIVELAVARRQVRTLPEILPDPGPIVTRELRQRIDSSGLTFAQIAAKINQACQIAWVHEYLVQRWYDGVDFPLLDQAQVISWLASSHLPNLF